jgi:dihydroorotase
VNTASVEIPTPDDWHLHLRDDEMLEAVVGASAQRYRYAMVMPNLRPPLVTSAAARQYRDRITQAANAPGFRPLITLFASSEINLDDLRAGFASGDVAAVKFYPAGATTNSDQAAGGLAEFTELFETMAELGMRLLVHAESTDPSVDVYDREAMFLERHLAPLLDRLPELAVTVEHVSTGAGVDLVLSNPQLGATITPHHLAKDRGDLLASGLKPDLYCKPIINSPSDRKRLVEVATEANPSFCMGTDSAPHPTTAKYARTGAAGVFNAAYGLEAVAEVFYQADQLQNLGAFVSHNGAAIYGVEPAETKIRLTRSPSDSEVADRLTTASGQEVVHFAADLAALWQIEGA